MQGLLFQINPLVGDLEGNRQKILSCLQQANEKNAKLVIFSEMVLTGYPAEDLLLRQDFIEKSEQILPTFAPYTQGKMVVLGTLRKSPKGSEKKLHNTAAIFINGKLEGYKDKTLLPTYDVFDERRYFEPGKEQKVFLFEGKKIGILICEDSWKNAAELSFTHYSRDPVQELKKLSPDLVINISASPYHFKKREERISLFQNCVEVLQCPFIWCNQVGANDELVFDGYSAIFNAQKELVQIADSFVEDRLSFDTNHLVKKEKKLSDPIEDLYQALVLGVKDYFQKQGFQKAIVGLSGGVDSAVVACIAKEALGAENLLALSMPSRFTSLESLEDAKELAQNLGIELQDLPIESLYTHFLTTLSPFYQDLAFNQAEENLQARIRGILLMAFSNKFGHIVLSTGNKSEMAVGYTTLYGDMCGGLGVINDVPKTQVYLLAKWIQQTKKWIPQEIIQKEPSAELRENQKDQDTLPPYEILDLILEEYEENFLSLSEIVQKHSLEEKMVQKVLHLFLSSEYKRRQAPPGIRVSKRAFSIGREAPIVQKWR